MSTSDTTWPDCAICKHPKSEHNDSLRSIMLVCSHNMTDTAGFRDRCRCEVYVEMKTVKPIPAEIIDEVISHLGVALHHGGNRTYVVISALEAVRPALKAFFDAEREQ